MPKAAKTTSKKSDTTKSTKSGRPERKGKELSPEELAHVSGGVPHDGDYDRKPVPKVVTPKTGRS